ncbi:hypothetical protein EI94DRAFT_1789664 [Lactarius quietus]|nr:hypothetical protein EI94DRAFT_1789664 [Lactarius quietus]
MANTKVWCLLIDYYHKATFGEPFPVSIEPHDTVHDLKTKIKSGHGLGDKLHHISPNEIEIWKCKQLKLSANVPFLQTKINLNRFDFPDEHGCGHMDVQHLAVAQKVMELSLETGELLLALIPRGALALTHQYAHLSPGIATMWDVSARPSRQYLTSLVTQWYPELCNIRLQDIQNASLLLGYTAIAPLRVIYFRALFVQRVFTLHNSPISVIPGPHFAFLLETYTALLQAASLSLRFQQRIHLTILWIWISIERRQVPFLPS